ncbi:MAG: EutN/CcmL family microcompartment protein [Planctomycetaceae bacterium]
MRVAEVIGKVTLSRNHPSLDGARWVIGVPLSAAGLTGAAEGRGEPLVIYDEYGAHSGSLLAFSEGAEATAPFHPHLKPLDAYNSALIDRIVVGRVD